MVRLSGETVYPDGESRAHLWENSIAIIRGRMLNSRRIRRRLWQWENPNTQGDTLIGVCRCKTLPSVCLYFLHKTAYTWCQKKTLKTP